jgi:NADH-quinone oxidoreductase subunit H
MEPVAMTGNLNFGALIISPLLALAIGIFFLGLARKVTARIQWRCGPPLAQPLIDIVRFFSQKSVSHGRLFDLGIVFSLAGSAAVSLFLPIGGICPLADSGGMLVILYLMLLAPLGLALSGGAAANPSSSIGVSRALILSLAYEAPLLLVLLAPMTHYRSISLVEIVQRQQSAGWALFTPPLVLSGIAYLLILPAILGFRPFEIVSAPQEISSGPLAEFGGKILAQAAIGQAFAVFIGIALFVNLFLGGGGNPAVFFLKMLAVFIPATFVHAVFPRWRTEQAVAYLWKWPTLLALAGLIIITII